MNDSALYIHIPFCEHKCIYCDFYSVITTDNIENYLKAIELEIIFYARQYSRERRFSSVFFGGGTPSLLNPEQIGRILTALRQNFDINGDAEITLETNPGTVHDEKLAAFRALGINRLSIGIQSFNDEDLKFLTRIHTGQQAISAVHKAYNAGFDNINIDLIFNLPGQSPETWEKNLTIAAGLPITHLSAYSLILERGTILNKMVLEKKVSLGDADYDAEIYGYTTGYLKEQLFEQYEVSNFARPGYECRHNKAYWEYRDYLSFGTAAHSFVNGFRWWNYRNLTRYIDEINSAGQACAGSEKLTDAQKLEEYIMLAFRSTGLNIEKFSTAFGEDWLNHNMPYLLKLEQEGFLTSLNGILRMTAKGYALCDEILENLL